MKHTLLAAATVAALGFAACGDVAERPAQQAPPVPTTGMVAPASATIPDTPTAAPAAASTPSTDDAAAPATPALAVNPPHGQPGHTCAIPVGAPMNTAPGAAGAAPGAPAAGASAAGASAAGATQPSISVSGSSQGGTPIQITAPPSGPSAAGAPAAAAPKATPAPASGGVRLNPPHGQPGHSCAIEVGKPLP